MKIVITMSMAERLGGSERLLWTFLREVDRDRVVPVVVFFAPGELERDVAGLGIRTYSIPFDRIRRIRHNAANVGRLARIFRRERPDAILGWVPRAHVYGGPAAYLAGMERRTAWWQHDFPDRDLGYRLATALPGRHVACCSDAVSEEQRQLWPRREVRTIYPGIASPRPLPSEDRRQLLQSFGMAQGRRVVGIIGRLIAWKGQHEFLRAVALLRDAGHDVAGLVVGSDAYGVAPDYEPSLRRLCAELKLEDRVVFTGQVSDPERYLQLMDVVVSASVREPFGLVLLEAMALGVPVVAVDAGGPREIVEDGRSGLLAPSPEAGSLARAAEMVLTDPELRSRMVAGGRERFEARFTAQHMNTSLEQWLTAIAAAARPPAKSTI